jgi:hypothetical protein
MDVNGASPGHWLGVRYVSAHGWNSKEHLGTRQPPLPIQKAFDCVTEAWEGSITGPTVEERKRLY